MGFAKAVTALATLEEKLRRVLGLAGEIGATFAPTMTPVIIAADLRDPGSAGGFSGRAWAFLHKEVTAASAAFSIRFDVDVVIDGIYASGPAAVLGPLVGWITVPGQAPAIAVTANAGTWIDRRELTTDSVPITISPNFGALGGTADSPTNRVWGTHSANTLSIAPLKMMLKAGSALNFNTTAAGSLILGVYGRIWP